jgi:hypothetical protein
MRTSAVSHTLSFSSAADRDLVASAAQGLEGGFEELVKRYQRPISGYVYRMVGDYDAALDLTQEIFIKIYGSLSRYRPSSNSRRGSTRLRITRQPITCVEIPVVSDPLSMERKRQLRSSV